MVVRPSNLDSFSPTGEPASTRAKSASSNLYPPMILAFLQDFSRSKACPSPDSLPTHPSFLQISVQLLSPVLGAFFELGVEKDLHILFGVVKGLWVEMLQALRFCVSARWMLQEMRCGVVYEAVGGGLCSFVMSLASFFRMVGVGRRENRMVSTSVSRYSM